MLAALLLMFKRSCQTIILVYFSVVAGGAVLVAASTATGLSLAPAWGGLLFGNFWKSCV